MIASLLWRCSVSFLLPKSNETAEQNNLFPAKFKGMSEMRAQSTLQKPAPLTVRGVYKTMKQIASEKGNGSSLRKQRAVLGLLRSARYTFAFSIPF